ncbi:hypothetical protein D0Z07_0787 [Hyphodiscus hymeniophilus]|uniref:DUF1776-domain-containing protein n=1 Tax=Hyphodiscus hymeniophilus TaxID=353542 RepID=A0A9P7B0L2_9HELO|nr:hypothetical protein D0Z07_0787 [Hyphodiscus hymeniophilus]
MSADDQAFLDTQEELTDAKLSSVPNEIRRYSNDVADYVDKHLDQVSNLIREALSSSPWIPESARPRPPPPPPRPFIQSGTPSSAYSQVQDWILKNKILTTVIVIAIGGVTYHVIRRKSHRKKRRAKKASNGARSEVVVIAGSPSEPITRSISLDLERRGFIVYVPGSARASIDRFAHHVRSLHTAFEGARPHHLSLRSLILIPSITYPSAPIAELPPSTLSDLLNTRLLTPIITLQTFLPLLTTVASKPSVLVLTPSIIAHLRPAFHLPESSLVAALSSFTDVLQAELEPLDIPVSHLQLGTFDFSSFSPHNKQVTTQSQRAETLRWEGSSRLAYGRNFVSTTTGSFSKGLGRGSSLRELNNAVFDAMVSGKGGVVRVGMGSAVYGFVGRWVPKGLVSWIMGLRKVEEDKDFGRGKELVLSEKGSRDTSPGSSNGGKLRYSAADLGLDESEFISVHGEKALDTDHDETSFTY